MEFTSLQRRLVACLGECCPFACRILLIHYTSSTFNDFGPKFAVVDPTGEQPMTGMIVSVDKVRYLPFSMYKCSYLSRIKKLL
jgi:hypothetical protein